MSHLKRYIQVWSAVMALPMALGFAPMTNIERFGLNRKSLPTSFAADHLHLNSDGESWAEEQRDELTKVLNRIDGLNDDIQAWNTTLDDDSDIVKKNSKAVEELEKEALAKLGAPIPPLGLTMSEYKASIKVFFNLPPSYRLALVKAIGMEDSTAGDPTLIPAIVTKLYEEQYTITRQRLAESLKERPNKLEKIGSTGAGELENDEKALEKIFGEIFEEKSIEQRDLESSVRQFLPRIVRKDGNMPLESDVQILIDAFDSKTFSSSSRPIEIPGGYVIRGENRKKTGEELITALDAKLPSDWNCTVSYMYDVSNINDDDNFFDEDLALVVLNKDFTPIASEWYYRGLSLVSFGTILLFCIGVYGSNQDVLNRLTDASSLGDFDGLDWFNGKVGQVLLPLLAILGSHEFGHFLVAQKNKIETTSLIPTFLPCFGSLPLLGTLTRLKSSPRNYTSLFDFAFSGPFLGFVVSFLFFGSGLLETKAALDSDASAAAQFLPSLPVSVLSLSTLGGSIIDYFFTGGAGYITSQDPATPIPLHPFAIAGYAGILINAAEMLPLGATDGARMSTTIFGRRGQSVIGGVTWLALLVSSFSLEDQQTALLITAWATNNVIQNDMEVPCRDESENPSLPRMAAAFGLWFLAILAITPITNVQ